MKYRTGISCGMGLIFALSIAWGCTSMQATTPSVGTEVTCIEGFVRYRSPVSSTVLPYGDVTISAWHHDKDQALTETKSDQEGRYCIEVPLGDYTVDLRVWGLERFEAQNYICQGSVDKIDMGQRPRKCGGDCIQVDILAECKERVEPRR
jgi:hypothetical protein